MTKRHNYKLDNKKAGWGFIIGGFIIMYIALPMQQFAMVSFEIGEMGATISDISPSSAILLFIGAVMEIVGITLVITKNKR